MVIQKFFLFLASILIALFINSNASQQTQKRKFEFPTGENKHPSLQATLATNTTCKLKFFAYDKENWKNISYGLMLGLHAAPPTPCLQCQNFANEMALINQGYVGLDAARDTVYNYQKMLKENPFVVFGKLLTITITFTNFFPVVDRIYRNTFWMSVPLTVIDILAD